MTKNRKGTEDNLWMTDGCSNVLFEVDIFPSKTNVACHENNMEKCFVIL